MYSCTIKGFFDQTYGKINKNGDYEKNVFFGFENWLQAYANQTTFNATKDEAAYESFMNWIVQPDRENQFVTQLLFNFPKPRYAVYEDPSYDRIKINVRNYFNYLVKQLGFFLPSAINNLLD